MQSAQAAIRRQAARRVAPPKETLPTACESDPAFGTTQQVAVPKAG